MSKFNFTIDTRNFRVKSIVNGNKAEPVATIRKTDGDAILIFFADEVAAELKKWRPQAHIKKSGTTGRYYAIIDESCFPKDIPSKKLVQSSIHKAFRGFLAVATADEAPIREFEFALVDGRSDFDNLRIELRNICRMAGKYTTYEKQKVAYYGSGQELTAATKLSIKKIIFNGPATVIFWTDGTKTVVRYNDATETIDDREKAVFAACAKKLIGTNATGSNYLDRIKPAFDAAQEEWAKRIVKEESK